MQVPRSLDSHDRSTVWRVVLLGVAAIAFAAMGIGFNLELLGGPLPIYFLHRRHWWPPLDLDGLFAYVLTLWVFLTTTSVALIPILVRPELARVLMLPCLLLLVLTSLFAWTDLWPEHWWNQSRGVVTFMVGNSLLTATCLLQYRAWSKDPEGPARRRLPLAMQLWLQTLWIPWPPWD